MSVKISENCHVCYKYLIFSAHLNALNNYFNFWLHFKNCDDQYCRYLGALLKICFCEEKYISLCMTNWKNVDFLSRNDCIRKSLEKEDGAGYTV
jgi:hypothetical protein